MICGWIVTEAFWTPDVYLVLMVGIWASMSFDYCKFLNIWLFSSFFMVRWCLFLLFVTQVFGWQIDSIRLWIVIIGQDPKQLPSTFVWVLSTTPADKEDNFRCQTIWKRCGEVVLSRSNRLHGSLLADVQVIFSLYSCLLSYRRTEASIWLLYYIIWHIWHISFAQVSRWLLLWMERW